MQVVKRKVAMVLACLSIAVNLLGHGVQGFRSCAEQHQEEVRGQMKRVRLLASGRARTSEVKEMWPEVCDISCFVAFQEIETSMPQATAQHFQPLGTRIGLQVLLEAANASWFGCGRNDSGSGCHDAWLGSHDSGAESRHARATWMSP